MDWVFSKAFRGKYNKSASSTRTGLLSNVIQDKATSKSDYGLHILVPQNANLNGCVDIVAIHGLNGHYLKTWTDEDSGVNWLTDLIPQVVPFARVMSFWYNSMLQFSKSTADISVFADQLLENLKAERNSSEELIRPIIFICHSLGGLVFKQAFNRAKESNKYMILTDHFEATFFFGTPHRGSGLASWANIVGNVLKAASFGTSTNVRLAKDLEPKSKLLEHISMSFINQCGELSIVSCYETSKMDYLSCLVVDKVSATLGTSAEIQIPLDGDHRNICRFSDINAKQFSPIKARLELFAGSAVTKTNHLSEELLKSLRTSDYVAHKKRNPPPVEGTCVWIFNHPLYKRWIESPSPHLLWVSADPGCGKSVLASFLVDHFSGPGMAGMNLCYFFFKSDNLEQSNAMNAIIALLHQLYTQQEVLITTGMNRLQGDNIQDLNKVWQVFTDSVERKDANNTICILDGIDECDPELRRRFLQIISDYFADKGREWAQAQEIGNKITMPKFKILVTSRPEIQIKIAFRTDSRSSSQNLSSISSQHAIIRLRGEDEIDSISDDIMKVVHAKVDELICQGFPIEVLNDIRGKILARADRTFLWVSLILSLLEQKVEAGASRRELDKLLRNRDIYNIYSELLATRLGSRRARKILMIMLAATRPMTVSEISIALAVVPEDETKRDGRTTLKHIEDDIRYPLENHIKSLCGHFIRIIRNRVYFVHETAREFLLKRGSETIYESNDIWPSSSGSSRPCITEAIPQHIIDRCSFRYSFKLDESQILLLKICATYLYCLGRTSKRQLLSTPTTLFLDYAAKSWVPHFQQANGSTSLDYVYYQNLCHPLFPGFRIWIRQHWLPEIPQHPPGNAYQIQDFYVRHFKLFPARKFDEDVNLDEAEVPRHIITDEQSKPDNTSTYDDEDDYFLREDLNMEQLRLSTNPTSLDNHHFPIQINRSGFVSLDFRGTGAQKAGTSRKLKGNMR